MGKSLKNRVERLTGRYGDLSDPMVRGQAIVRAMSIEEIHAELRRLLLANGYDPSLPHAEALAAYIAKREAELPALTKEDQGWSQQSIALLKKDPKFVRDIFPESPSLAEFV